MRIVAGKYRSRKLRTLRGLALRPTSDRLRETLFDILGPAVEGSLFLDVYAGTGAVGIEALSRGACEVIFIEGQPAAAEMIRANLRSLEISSGTRIILNDAVEGLRELAARGVRADFIFLDPAYADAAEYERALAFLDDSPLLVPRGRLILEHHWKQKLPVQLDRLECVRQVEQGETVLSFYRLALAA